MDVVDWDWKFLQSFGDDNSSDDDLVTAVQFDHTGNTIAIGDKAGRICLFKAFNPETRSKSPFSPQEYKFFTEFQSHDPEFDCLKSLEIEERIQTIRFIPSRQNSLVLLAANGKTIKLWKVQERAVFPQVPSNREAKTFDEIKIPQIDFENVQRVPVVSCKKTFANGHGYHVNSVSVSADGESFISADDLRINLWHPDISTECFNVLDVKPPNLEDLTEVITSTSFHPRHSSIILTSSTRGAARICDLRDAALCDHHSKMFEVEEDPAQKTFFSELVSSISQAKFTPNGRYILCRDYFTLKLWDVTMENRPVAEVPVHDYLKNHLVDLYENDCVFDKFGCATNGDGTRFVTGSYNNFVIHDHASNNTTTVEVMKDPPRRREKKFTPNVAQLDFSRKALHTAWHPRCNTVAVAGLNKLYIYQASNTRSDVTL